MLSDDLYNIAHGLRALADGDRDREDLAGLVRLAASLLLDHARDARALEQQVIPLRAQMALDRLPPDVASLDDFRLRRMMEGVAP